ncbi:glycosyl hydrolase family 18 protein [Pueribacillus sp. YX66]|uniref:glycosyl hydrolase family 18 protein n=1 Tax=Pueribacillus sp. YX66 TaxID=3229242 RepID=UPI00358D4D7D
MKKFVYIFFVSLSIIGGILLLFLLSTSKQESEIYSMSFIYFGDKNDYIDFVDRTNGAINVVSPNYFNLKSDGELKVTEDFDVSFVQEMQKRSVKVVPFLSNHWDQDLGKKALKNRESLSTQIASFIQENDLGGVSVDLENLTEQDREDFVHFIKLLRNKLPTDKELSICIPSNPDGHNEGYFSAFDYQKLVPHIDHFILMTYDQSYEGSDEGPVASLPWVEQSIHYILSQGVSSEKIVMGIPFYGRIWSEDGVFKGTSMGNYLIAEMLHSNPSQVIYNENFQSPKAKLHVIHGNEYFVPGKYTIWYEDEKSIASKLSLVHKYDLKGVASWALSMETEETWSYFHDELNNP